MEVFHKLRGCISIQVLVDDWWWRFVEIMGLVPGNKLGGGVWCNDFGKDFACGNIRLGREGHIDLV